ncbi:hypothetical protein EW146_g6286 [Bondarzewia mesenterica]|uniref:DUF6699 domain-containing protein n=1 Tax=Bondarzewia mesenterica TaxID=1095465 RepID=A0A4S4LPM5_9AGAM|nr:hypothetical protein EW146_g6286 [Bondarzewia mesenterica]
MALYADMPPLVNAQPSNPASIQWPSSPPPLGPAIPSVGTPFPAIHHQFPGVAASGSGGQSFQWPSSPPAVGDPWGVPGQAFQNSPYSSPQPPQPGIAAPAPHFWNDPNGNVIPCGAPANWVPPASISPLRSSRRRSQQPYSQSYPQPYDPGTYEPRTGESATLDLPHPTPSTPHSSASPASQLQALSRASMRHDRPGNWRPDFRMPRSGFDAIFPILMRRQKSLSQKIAEYGPHTLNSFIRFGHFRDPPIVWDLRENTSRIQFRELRRPVTGYDLNQFATEPPLQFMRLYHTRLPWYIDVFPRDPVGITLQDLFTSMYGILLSRIKHSDLYNSDVTADAESKMLRAYAERCNGDEYVRNQGIMKVDFLMRDFIFLGLSKGKNGMWEMKTRKL